MPGSRVEAAACLAGLSFAVAACDAVLGLNEYRSCSADCDAGGVGSTSSPEPGDAADASDGADAWSAYDVDAATGGDAQDHAQDGAQGSAETSTASRSPPPRPVWAQWPMPNPGAASAPDSSLPLPNAMLYDAGVDGSVFDVVTGLQWQTEGSQGAQDYSAAVASCVGLGAGWRVPARIELVSLIDFTRIVGPAIDQATFVNTQRGSYWTSSAVPNDGGAPAQWWTVSFETGLVDNSTSAQWVRCVRGGLAP